MTTEPTDAEILDAADDFRSQYNHGGTTFDEFDALSFARAVLAKWGTPQPSPTAQAAESVPAVMSGDELVRLGKSPESGLYPWGIGTTRADYLRAVRAVLAAARAPAESAQEEADLPPLPDPDLRDVGTKPQDVKDFLKGYATEYARLALAARAPAESVRGDAERYRWLWHEDNDEIVLCNGPVAKKYWYLPRNEKLGAAIDSAMAANGGKQVMKIPELFSLMRLLSAMESAMLASKSVSPDYPSDEVARLTEILEREILARSKEQTP